MHMIRLIIMAEIPSVIIISFTNGTGTSISFSAFTVRFASILPRITRSKNEMLQMNVSFEKNEITFMNYNSLKYSRQNNINLLD